MGSGKGEKSKKTRRPLKRRVALILTQKTLSVDGSRGLLAIFNDFFRNVGATRRSERASFNGLETFGFAAGDGRGAAPNVEIHRVGDETDASVGHSGVDAAVVAASSRVTSVLPIVRRGVVRRVERLERRTPMAGGDPREQTVATPTRGTAGRVDRAVAAHLTFDVSAERRRALLDARKRTGVAEHIAAHLRVVDFAVPSVFAGTADRFGNRQRIARTVGQRRHIRVTAAVEKTVGAKTRDLPRSIAVPTVKVHRRTGADDVVPADAVPAGLMREGAVAGFARAADNRNRNRNAVLHIVLRVAVERTSFGAPNRFGVVEEVGERGLFDKRQEARRNGERASVAEGREKAVRIVVIVERERPLLDVVDALHTSGRFARRLNGREKQADQNTDNRDHDQQLDERKTERGTRNGAFHRANLQRKVCFF